MADIDTGGRGSRERARDNDDGGAGGKAPLGRKLAMAAVAVVALAAFTAVIVYSYDRAKQPGQEAVVPLIKAAEGPTKVRPKEPGGMIVPDRDKQVFSRVNPNEKPPPVERLLPLPESAAVWPPPMPELKPPPEMDAATDRVVAAVPPAGSRVIETLIAAPPAPVDRPAPAAEKPAAEKAAKRDVVAATEAPAAKPAKKAAEKPAKKAPVSAPEEKPRKTAAPQQAKAVPGAGAASGRWNVQIAAFRSEAAVKRSWQKISRDHKDLFGKLRLSVVRADLGTGRGVYYRMQAGPLGDAAAAKALCALIKQRKLGCFVVRR